jgi:hypothetical protein
MKLMVMHKTDAVMESEPKPTQALIQSVGALVAGAMESGRFVDAAGLRASRHRVRVRFEAGTPSVTQGPYSGDNELVSSFEKLKVADMDEAIAWASRLALAAGDDEVEVGPVTEPWDLGLVEKPEAPPLQVLVLHKASAASEAGTARSEAQRAAYRQVVAEATAAGVLLSAHTLLPSSKAVRVSGAKGARRVVDGPFSESKELVGGFIILQFDSMAEAITWTQQYADVVGTPEVDIREVA